MLVELKNGETLNGHLVSCDTWMNLTLKEVVQTSPVCLHSPRSSYPLPRAIRLHLNTYAPTRFPPSNVPWLICMLLIGRRQVLQTGRSICEGQQCMLRCGKDLL